MDIINVIVTDLDSDNNTNIVSLDSFAVIDEQNRDEVVLQAENHYISKIGNISDDIVEKAIEDGYIYTNGNYIALLWSYSNNE